MQPSKVQYLETDDAYKHKCETNSAVLQDN